MKKQINTDSPTSQKLTLLNLSQLDKQIDEIKNVTLAEGKFNLDISLHFRSSQIQKVIMDYQKAIEVIRNETLTTETVSDMILIYNMCIIKHFTNLGIKNLDTSKKKDIQKLITVAKQLLDSGVFKEIMESFDSVELNKIQMATKTSGEIGDKFGEIFTSIGFNGTEMSEENGNESESNIQDDTRSSEQIIKE